MFSHLFSKHTASSESDLSQHLILWVLTLVSALIFDLLPDRNERSASTGRRNNLNLFHAQFHCPSLSMLIQSLILSTSFVIVPYSAPYSFQSLPKCKQMLFSCSFLFFLSVSKGSFISFHPLTCRNLICILFKFSQMITSSEWLE